MEFLGYQYRLLDSRLFWRKVVMLVVFFGLFVVLKAYQEQLLFWYSVFLLALHVYIFFVFLYRVKWRVLASDRKSFAVRLVAIAVFVLLLTVIKAGATLTELAVFVGASGFVHLLLLLSLTVEARPAASRVAESSP